MKGAGDFDQQWYVLYTKSRHEKKVADRLRAAGFTVYCPLQKINKRWSDRTKIIEEPLFKGYILFSSKIISEMKCSLFQEQLGISFGYEDPR